MKILLVNPITRNVSLASPDLGLGYLSTALKRNHHRVEILDCVNRKWSFEAFETYIARTDADVVGFKVFSTDLLSVKKSVDFVKSRRPDIKIILGGAHPSYFPEQTLQYFENADFAIRGEAEKGLADLLTYLSRPESMKLETIPGLIWKSNNEIHCNPPVFPEDLDALGSPDWNGIDPRHYPFQTSYLTKSKIVAPLIITRGCPYACTFCAVRSITGNKIRAHSVSYIIREIKYLQSAFQISEVCFIDDNFLVFKDLVAELLEQIIRQKINIQWSCYGIRLDMLDKAILSLMEKSGCYLLTVGIESGSQRILDHMKKNLTVDMVREKINFIRKESRINVIGNFILGYPEETEEDIRKTIRFAKSLPLYGANFFPFHPTPGTEIFNQLVARQEIRDIDWKLMGLDLITYIPRGLSRKKFTWLFSLAFIKFYLRPRIILNVLSATRSFERLKYLLDRVFTLLLDFFKKT
jgi:radical SAM superfamily enzyme YgiQ (UPF0313 family)